MFGKEDHSLLLNGGFLMLIVYAVYLMVRMAAYTGLHVVTRRIGAEDYIEGYVLS